MDCRLQETIDIQQKTVNVKQKLAVWATLYALILWNEQELGTTEQDFRMVDGVKRKDLME